MVRLTRNKCPPGTFCMSSELLGIGLLAAGVAAGVLWTKASAPVAQQQPAPLTVVAQTRSPPPQAEDSYARGLAVGTAIAGGGDDRYTRAPKPERDWLARPDMSTLWNAPTSNGALPTIATRGIPESYQSMGVLTTSDGQALPLYGRRTGARSDRFQYYTRTDTYNPVQLPISYKKRDCQDDVGCEELMDGDEIKIPTNGATAKATLYRFSGPTYVPIV